MTISHVQVHLVEVLYSISPCATDWDFDPVLFGHEGPAEQAVNTPLIAHICFSLLTCGLMAHHIWLFQALSSLTKNTG